MIGWLIDCTKMIERSESEDDEDSSDDESEDDEVDTSMAGNVLM